MPLKVSELRNDVRHVVAHYLDHEIKVSYRPAAVPASEIINLQRTRDDEDPAASTVATINNLSAMLVGWDVVDDDGKPFPTDAEHLATFPQALINAILQAIVDDQNPTKRKLKR